MSSPPAGKPARQLRWNLPRKRAKPKRPIKDELWEAHKAEIVELYIVRDKTANEVIAAVSTDEFAPSCVTTPSRVEGCG